MLGSDDDTESLRNEILMAMKLLFLEANAIERMVNSAQSEEIMGIRAEIFALLKAILFFFFNFQNFEL